MDAFKLSHAGFATRSKDCMRDIRCQDELSAFQKNLGVLNTASLCLIPREATLGKFQVPSHHSHHSKHPNAPVSGRECPPTTHGQWPTELPLLELQQRFRASGHFR